jgi:hypothetical protein
MNKKKVLSNQLILKLILVLIIALSSYSLIQIINSEKFLNYFR